MDANIVKIKAQGNTLFIPFEEGMNVNDGKLYKKGEEYRFITSINPIERDYENFIINMPSTVGIHFKNGNITGECYYNDFNLSDFVNEETELVMQWEDMLWDQVKWMRQYMNEPYYPVITLRDNSFDGGVFESKEDAEKLPNYGLEGEVIFKGEEAKKIMDDFSGFVSDNRDRIEQMRKDYMKNNTVLGKLDEGQWSWVNWREHSDRIYYLCGDSTVLGEDEELPEAIITYDNDAWKSLVKECGIEKAQEYAKEDFKLACKVASSGEYFELMYLATVTPNGNVSNLYDTFTIEEVLTGQCIGFRPTEWLYDNDYAKMEKENTDGWEQIKIDSMTVIKHSEIKVV